MWDGRDFLILAGAGGAGAGGGTGGGAGAGAMTRPATRAVYFLLSS